MVRTLFTFVALLACVSALQAAAPKPAYELLPQTTQAVVWMPDSAVLSERWGRTQLSQLADDPKIKEFWQDQQGEIEEKLTAAGWKLHIQPRSLSDVVEGQVALAWIERKEVVQKPYALVLVVDVIGRQVQVEKFLKDLDTQLMGKGSERKKLTHGGVDIAWHRLKAAGEFLPQDTYYAVINEQLLASDDIAILQSLIDAAQDKSTEQKLDKEPIFVEARKQLEQLGEGQVEYFARPLGFARILREMSGKRNAHKTDVLAVLQDQGFESLKAVAGELKLGTDRFDMVHRGFVLAAGNLKDRPTAVQLLDFPNEVRLDVPSWVSDKVSSVVSVCWNVKEAFWKAEGLVDGVAGQPKVFKEIIDGIKVDPTGPKIDIKNEVMPLLTNEIYAISDTKFPIDVDSKRNLIALRVTNANQMSKILDRAMEREPDAKRIEIAGQNVWKVKHEPEEDLSAFGDFEDFKGNNAGGNNAGAGNNQPLLSNWAITVFGDYLLFASHEELIDEAIQLAKAGQPSSLSKQEDFQRVLAAFQNEVGNDGMCVWRINRSALAYRVPYELFRAGKLQGNQGMFTVLLENLFENKSEVPAQPKKRIVNGDKLPPFEAISKYLEPSGAYVRTVDNGWTYGSMLLAKSKETPEQGASNAANKPVQNAATTR